MDIPSHVLAAAEAADKILYGDPAPPQDETVVPEVVTAGVTPQLDLTEPLKAQIETLKAQLVTLQGKYNAEIKALGDDPLLLNTLKAENRQLKRQNTDFSRIISDQQHQIAAAQAAKTEIPKQSATPATTQVLTQEELDHLEAEGFDGKTLDIIKKLVGPDQTKRYGEPKPEPTVVTPGAMPTQQAASIFWEDLSLAVPNWREINGSPDKPNVAWLDWLDLQDPIQGRPRVQILHDAQEKLDALTCIRIFNNFIREVGVKPKFEAPKPVYDPADLIEPGKGPTGAVTEKPTYTMAQYQKHYGDFTKGVWKGREAAWEKFAAELDKALQEGRIT